MRLIRLFTPEVELAAKKHAELCYPEESCGIVVNGKYIAMTNKAEDKLNSFLIDPSKLLNTEVQAIIHSHPNAAPVPSAADMQYQINTAVPWGIFQVEKDSQGEFCFSQIIWFGDECPRLPLVGRPFVHGVTDCYGLIRDVYKEELGVHLIDFPRDWNWWYNGGNLYEDCFKKAGFRKIPQQEVKKYDLVISCLGMRNGLANHGSVYYGDEMVIHHIAASLPVDFSRVSTIVPAQPYLKRAVFFLRHESCDK